MKKKRKLKIGRLLLVIFVLLALITVSGMTLNRIIKSRNDGYVFNKDELYINDFDYSEMKSLDLDLYSGSYMLIRLNDFKVLYGRNINSRIYPASLTKIVTMDTVLKNVKDLDDVSSYSDEDYEELIEANASVAGLKVNTPYTIKELLYALVLPSGADAGKALENYFHDHGMDLVEEMNELVKSLGLSDTHFTNTSGLHDDDLYTSLDDYARIVTDTLLDPQGKEILKSFRYELEDGTVLKSTLERLQDLDGVEIYGGKTGFTGEAGENIMVLYSHENRSYLLILANAPGNPYAGQLYHFNDVSNILEYLYNN